MNYEMFVSNNILIVDNKNKVKNEKKKNMEFINFSDFYTCTREATAPEEEKSPWSTNVQTDEVKIFNDTNQRRLNVHEQLSIGKYHEHTLLFWTPCIQYVPSI